MIRLLLARISGGPNSTIGAMLDATQQPVPFKRDRSRFLCWTVEDEHRDVKVMHETRVAAGTYPLVLRPLGDSRFDPRYTERFGAAHKGMLWVKGVPNFEWVLIHMGNTEKHTSGCIIVGASVVTHEGGGGEVRDSLNAYVRLYDYVSAALLRGEEVTLTIQDEPTL